MEVVILKDSALEGMCSLFMVDEVAVGRARAMLIEMLTNNKKKMTIKKRTIKKITIHYQLIIEQIKRMND